MRVRLGARIGAGVALPLMLLLVGCGLPGAGHGDPTPGSAQLNGCVVQQAPKNWPPADVVLTATTARGATATSGNDFITRVTVRRGQVVDVRLDAKYMWRVTTAPAATILAMAQPAGWYDGARRECVWRFSAAGTGVARADWAGGMVCPPHTACPALAAIAYYEITVR